MYQSLSKATHNFVIRGTEAQQALVAQRAVGHSVEAVVLMTKV
jgi:hypothetical protein